MFAQYTLNIPRNKLINDGHIRGFLLLESLNQIYHESRITRRLENSKNVEMQIRRSNYCLDKCRGKRLRFAFPVSRYFDLYLNEEQITRTVVISLLPRASLREVITRGGIMIVNCKS